jgi:hypothetical protein
VGLLLSITLVNPRTAYRHHLDPADRGLFEWARSTNENALFHIVSSDIWFSFDFRANTLRSITGSWKDGGICHYSDVNRFFEWDARMRQTSDDIAGGQALAAIEHAATFGADFAVIDLRLRLTDGIGEEVVFENPRWQVRAITRRVVTADGHNRSYGVGGMSVETAPVG